MKWFRLDVYVPLSHLESVKNALLNAGAGSLGNYDSCCWVCRGKGQFRPLPGADPFAGSVQQLEQMEEWKIELIFPENQKTDVLKALKQSHPYETPAFQYWAVEMELPL